MSENPILRRFWFKLDGDRESPLGYGVTAWTEEDAAGLLRSICFRGEPLPRASITADVDVSSLDAGHIRPNMESPNWRGIWFPRGFAGAMPHEWPIRRFERADGKARLFILKREDGLFRYEGEREEYEPVTGDVYWAPADISGLYESAEAAERAARASVPWFREQDSN